MSTEFTNSKNEVVAHRTSRGRGHVVVEVFMSREEFAEQADSPMFEHGETHGTFQDNMTAWKNANNQVMFDMVWG